jgi:hypothetical protein
MKEAWVTCPPNSHVLVVLFFPHFLIFPSHSEDVVFFLLVPCDEPARHFLLIFAFLDSIDA